MDYFNKIKTENGFKFSEYSNQTILSTSFGVLTKQLLQEDIENKEKIIQYLLGSRNNEGYFIDSNYKYHSHPEHNSSYVIPQFTFFTLSALDVLGVKNMKIDFLNDFNEEKLLDELNKSMEKNFWATSNQLMFLMYFITYRMKYLKDDSFESYIDIIFNYLNQNQNLENGFWGDDKTTKSIYAKAYGAAHIYLFYDYYKREIPNINKIIDHCLLMHCNNGLIQTVEGGACEDYDIVEIYFRCLKQTDYRKEEIFNKLRLMRKTLLNDMRRDHSFSYKTYSKSGFYKYFDSKVKNQKYKYSSWDYMETPVYLSDAWGTFFKHLALKMIGNIIENDTDYNSSNLPSWGYI
ncbi:hypothetical protein [uncultured Lutibacter sp.]|uniref:hypothetical protein n=1 Tax=uncultured Lutibacter sp. TaxID=437739 RepID=UPI0026185814|nr:hypothetical protein [uncultured Lutibacter sp.]